jgi:hypothetical protein
VPPRRESAAAMNLVVMYNREFAAPHAPENG